MPRTPYGHEIDAAPLSARDAEVVQAIEEEGLTVFSFDGLRRITGAHPETLSRALDRLEEQGVVTRAPEGYIVTERAKEVPAVRPLGVAEARIPLLHTLLPYDVKLSEVVSQLKGKWFGALRWVGYSLSEEGTVLKWVTDDGAVQIDARFSPGQLDIDAKVAGRNDVSEAVKASHQLMSHVSKLYAPRGGRILQFAVPAGYLNPASM
ncbi:MAG: hypothetical protein OK422_01310 [Thaumarchaeota archaeon]|nr:hypothetical protein [Nitrososphaerota archaeon]